uniref:SAYSvFN domain-containing protein n=1 Tax=Oryza glumipatula TaxID=40148 RepID=A0A0E0B6Z3_9ORYZ
MAMAAAGDEAEMVEVTLRAVGPSRPTTLRLPPFISKSFLLTAPRPLHAPRLPICAATSLTTDISHKTASAWSCEEGISRAKTTPMSTSATGVYLIVAVAPKPPANHLRDGDGDDDDDEEEELKFKIPETTTWWKKKIFIFLRDKLRLPDILLMVLFSLGIKAWVLIAMWFLFAPIAQMYDVGPLFILGTGFLVILCNLGRRQQGDVSAYSIFNEDFRELPGTLNAERIDRDIRAGQF